MSAFNQILDSYRYHNFGGSNSKISCEPYITGYGFIKWYLPEQLNKYLIGYNSDITNDQTWIEGDKEKCGNILSAACIGVTPVSESITTIDYEGASGTTFSNPGKIIWGNTASVKYLEMSGLPIYRIHKVWIEMIKENKVGLNTQPPYDAQNNRKDNYAGKLLYWTTKPDGVTVEYFALYSGIFPVKSQDEDFATDISSIDKVELNIDYHVDYVWTEDWVYNLAVKAAKEKPYGGKDATRHTADGYFSKDFNKNIMNVFSKGGSSSSSSSSDINASAGEVTNTNIYDYNYGGTSVA